ncbi:cysteine desulfurase [Tepidiforma flava]|uniref:cysteine desulfurase n=1 Tax=Tepidiforma flava TaxID=3004094 RepID=A0ABY7M603_9CHLR|nr:cysteine desulfurase [Tepidiforma flava]WBL35413.1 cysteine desulfurase [Tepidiforma flava]
MLDIARVREDFPILGQQVNGRRLVYLDNAATTQKPRQVIEALVRYYETSNANIHRGIHTLATRATEQYEAARARVARFIGAAGPQEVIFTRNATEAINLVARAWGDACLTEGDEIVLTVMEHHSNIVPWQLLAARTGARLRYAGITADGKLDLDGLRQLIGPRTKLVAVTQMSNVLGTINPVSDIAEMARAAGALLLVDGAQGVPHLPVDVSRLGADFLAFSAHKMLGPTGVGVLWAREALLAAMPPFLGGGDMIAVVQEEMSTWADLPHKFEAGTPNIADVVAFGAAIAYLEGIGMENVRRHEEELTALALERLRRVPGLRVFGPASAAERGGVVSFAMEAAHPHDVATIADGYGVAIRAGHHCAQLLMRALGVPATSRASFSIYNGEDDLEALIEALEGVNRVFGEGRERAAVR